MPSLQALEEFKSSFSSIGDELRTLAELQLPVDDLPLPPPSFAADNAEADIFGDLNDLLGGISDSPQDLPAGPEDADFSSFIDSIPDDFAQPEIDTNTLLDGLADEIELQRASGGDPAGEDSLADFSADFPAEDFSAETLSGDESPAFDLGELPQDIAVPDAGDDFDASALWDDVAGEAEAEQVSGEESAVEDDFQDSFADAFADAPVEDLPEDLSAGDSADFSAETLADDFAQDEIQAFDSGDEPFAESFSDEPFADTETTDFSDDDDDESFDSARFGDGELPAEFDNNTVLEELSGDSFDSFKLDANALAEDYDLVKEEGGGSAPAPRGTDDFSLAGIDDVFDGASASAAASLPAGNAAKAASKKAGITDVDEIRLTSEEFQQLQATLASYPLNLRIACQELIAERAVDPGKMHRMIKLLVAGAPAQEAASLAGKILDKNIPIPKGFEKKTGEALEAEQSSFGYIFVHNFLPVFRLFLVVALVGLCAAYLGWRFIYTPIRADGIYQLGMERIQAGDFARANERFWEAFAIHPRQSWFFEYARAYTGANQFILAEQMYQELLYFSAARNRRGIPDKAAVLEYAHLVSSVLGHHERADRIIRHNLLDFTPWDRDGLLALGDNALAWGEYDPSRFEDAREAFATVMERFGRTDPLLERMLLFFIRTDNLGEVLALQSYFMASERRLISAATLAEMGGYFLDKRLEEVRGVPDAFLDNIGGIRQVLLRAIQQDPMLPESYFHLARYYEYFNNQHDERLTLEVAIRAFDAAPEGSPQRIRYHINALRRHAEILIRHGYSLPAAEYLIQGIAIHQNAVARRLLTPAPEFGRLYALMGDMELFVRELDMQAALEYYRLAEQNGWAPPEIQYRMGVAYYHLGEWGPALERFLAAHREMPLNRRILHALGNASFLRGNYFAAQGFFDQLLVMLYADRDRLPPILPGDGGRQMELAERIMVTQNNLGVTLQALTERTGDNSFRARSQGLYAESARAWDILSRDPETMIRQRPIPGIDAPTVNAGFFNIQNILNPAPDFQPHFFPRIDMDMFEVSEWERLSPLDHSLVQ